MQYTDWLSNEKFISLQHVKETLDSSLPDQYISQVGYIQPGHGIKGKQIWLNNDRDVEEMYIELEGTCKSEVVLWCYRNETVKKTEF